MGIGPRRGSGVEPVRSGFKIRNTRLDCAEDKVRGRKFPRDFNLPTQPKAHNSLKVVPDVTFHEASVY